MAATAMAPVVRFDDPACEHGPIRVQALTGHDETQLVKPAEHGQVRAAESGIPGSVVHVEVFQMGSVRTSILGRPRYLSRDRRAEHQPSSATPCFVKSPFSPEYKDEAAKMVIQESRPVATVAREIGVNEQTLRNWVNAYRRAHAGEEPPLTLSERARLRELEAEVRELRLKSEFLGKAAAFFAQEYR
jgi:transposase